VLEGTIDIPAASAFGDPGFHESVVLTGTVPEAAAEQPGDLVVRLRDVDHPNQTCNRDHPLSGCVTIDWSDIEDRPRVPTGGVFGNHLNVVSTSGDVMLFLSEDRGLAGTPDNTHPLDRTLRWAGPPTIGAPDSTMGSWRALRSS
jgi:hypothetical protein